MEVRCDKCQARYKVDDARIGPQGLTMRCGKCQNTFKVTRPDGAGAPATPAPKPVAKPASDKAAPAKAAPVKAAPVKATPAAAPDEGAGRTMMFNTGSLKTSAPPPKAAPKAPEPEGGATMVFGQSPLAKPAAPAPAAPARPKPAAKSADDAAGSTMMFGASPAAAAKPAVKPAPPPPAKEHKPVPEPAQAASEAETDEEAEALTTQSKPQADEPLARTNHDEDHGHPHGGVEAEGAESGVDAEGEEPGAESTFDKAPPKGLLIGVAAGLAALLLAGGGLVAMKKMGKRPPPPAAMETLSAAQGAADKDTAASLADAEKQARDAQDVAGPKADFPQAVATLAQIQIQEADANSDLAALWTEKANRAGEAGNDAKKTEAEAKATELQGKAKAQLKGAFELVATAIKAGQKSPDLELALADYYRAQKSSSNMNKELKKARALKGDEGRIALIQALAAAQEEDGAEKALPKLKALLAQNPQSARLHFKLALAHQQLKDDVSMKKELAETLKLSPQHERAKLLQEIAAGEQK